MLSLSASGADITFADSHVKAVCVEHWDTNGDGELSEEEAAAVISLQHYFTRDAVMRSFDELRYFTGLSSIASSEFYACSRLTSIQLPPQVTSIGDNAFRSCVWLSAVDIPASVRTINENAFNGCIRMTEATMHEGLETIGKLAFCSCKSLQAVSLPASVTSIGVTAFQGCMALDGISVANGNTVYDSRGECNAIIQTANNTMVLGCCNSTFPESVTAIGNSAFSGCSRLEQLTIPEGIVTIGPSAFSSCTGLLSVSLPASVTTIGNTAFSGCTSLTGLRLQEGLKTIGVGAFEQCRSLPSVSIPATVTTLSENAFYECPKLVEVTVGFATPIAITGSTFSNSTNATLYVPVGSVPAFEEALYWRSFYIITEKPVPGDVNHDGFVNIYDVTLMIDYILGKEPEGFYIKEADLNDDGYVNIYDVTLVIDVILGKEI